MYVALGLDRLEGDLTRDEGIRADSSIDKLARLKPSFRPEGTITAGNASPLNDGAAAVLLGSAAAAFHIGFDPMARIDGRRLPKMRALPACGWVRSLRSPRSPTARCARSPT